MLGMSEIKWIKIKTDIFDDEKICLIDALPDRDAIIVIWIKLITLAGKLNTKGVLAISKNIVYTDEMLAQTFHRPLNTVRMALEVFEKFGMVEKIDGVIMLPNWEKHQNIDGMEKIKEQNRNRAARHRQKQKLLAQNNESNVTDNVMNNVTVTHGNALDKDKELDKEYILSGKTDYTFPDWLTPEMIEEITKGKPERYLVRIPLAYLNHSVGKNYKYLEKNLKHIMARFNEGYTLEDFKQVIDVKTEEWKDNPEFFKYLRPETLFGSKFDSYLNQKPKITKNKPDNNFPDLPF